MNILFDATHPVKSTRRPFGLGLTRTLPRRERFAPSAADRAWAAANLNIDARDYEVVGVVDSILEQGAGCALAQARLDMGACPF